MTPDQVMEILTNGISRKEPVGLLLGRSLVGAGTDEYPVTGAFIRDDGLIDITSAREHVLVDPGGVDLAYCHDPKENDQIGQYA